VTRREWLPAEVLALPAVIDLVTAGSVLSLGRTKTHELARLGQFPVPVLRLGSSYRVPTAPLKALLGLEDSSANSEAEPATGSAFANLTPTPSPRALEQPHHASPTQRS